MLSRYSMDSGGLVFGKADPMFLCYPSYTTIFSIRAQMIASMSMSSELGNTPLAPQVDIFPVCIHE